MAIPRLRPKTAPPRKTFPEKTPPPLQKVKLLLRQPLFDALSDLTSRAPPRLDSLREDASTVSFQKRSLPFFFSMMSPRPSYAQSVVPFLHLPPAPPSPSLTASQKLRWLDPESFPPPSQRIFSPLPSPFPRLEAPEFLPPAHLVTGLPATFSPFSLPPKNSSTRPPPDYETFPRPQPL